MSISRQSERSAATGMLSSQQGILAALLLLEVCVFGVLGTNFFTMGNGFEVLRLSVEIGLLALAMTPVIVTGGIDLSVGSLMGLAAVLFGMLWKEVGLPIGLAAVLTLGVGAVAGAINAVGVTRLRLPPLIVTLGSFSLYRGMAEGLTGGYVNYTNFPADYLFLGQGYFLGVLPAQLPVFIVVAVAFWFLLHRTTTGRALMAIGFSPDGARHAGINVERKVGLVYVLSGLVASLAAIIYVAHLGQAKADAGTGYELMAITAVVLGGTSIFGGKGSIAGTLLGLLTIAVLQNGLRLSDLPAELAGILNGLLLLGTISLDGVLAARATRAKTTQSVSEEATQNEELDMKNWQLVVLCGAILLAAFIVAGSNKAVVEALKSNIASRGDSTGRTESPVVPPLGSLPLTISKKEPPKGGTTNGKKLTVAMMPKQKGNAYFIACRKGADEAAKELGINLLWDGPTDTDPAEQNKVIDTWITRGVDVLAIAVENREGLSTVLRKAKQKGIKVVTWDSDAEPDARDFFINQATPDGIAHTLMDTAAKVLGGKGEFAIIMATLTAANQIDWRQRIEARLADKYPDIKLAVVRPCDDKQAKAFEEAGNILNAYPSVKLIMGICSPSVPGAGEAVKQSGRKDVSVIGLSLPNDNKRYVHEGITKAVILWNTADLGYLTVHAAKALHEGSLKPGDAVFQGGRLGAVKLEGDSIVLGEPFAFTKENIDDFDF